MELLEKKFSLMSKRAGNYYSLRESAGQRGSRRVNVAQDGDSDQFLILVKVLFRKKMVLQLFGHLVMYCDELRIRGCHSPSVQI